MRRNGSSGGIIFALIMLLIFGDVVGGLFFFIFPMLFPLAIFAIVYNAIRNKKPVTNTSRVSTTVSNSYLKQTKISNADLVKIDKKLMKFFNENVALPIIDGISLVTQNGKYSSVDQLYIAFGDEKVIKLNEYKAMYPDSYNKIISLLKAFAKQSNEVLKAEIKADSNKAPKLSTSQQYIDRINALNREIPHEEITNGLYQTCDLLKQIEVASKDKKDDKLDKLYDYYLPILMNILENYKKLQDAPIKGEEFKDCETQLIKTIILINQALKTIYSSMHEDDYMNLSADITTLQSLLKKDGLVEGSNPFAKGDNNNE